MSDQSKGLTTFDAVLMFILIGALLCVLDYSIAKRFVALEQACGIEAVEVGQ